MLDEITVGDNGFIFLTGGSNRVLEIYRGEYKNCQWAAHWETLFREREEKVGSYGADYLHISAPEKILIYHEFLPDEISSLIDLNYSPSREMARRCRAFINPELLLKEASKDHLVYSKTDSHWNIYGVYQAYLSLMRRLNLAPQGNLLDVLPTPGNCVMDLAGKLAEPYPESVVFYKPTSNVKRVYSNEIVQYKEENNLLNDVGLHVGSVVEFENIDASHNKKVLLFGDSFSEYRPHLLTGILAETFRSVRFVWGINLDYTLIEKFSPDIVISETAERFLPNGAPNDTFNYEDYSKRKIASMPN